MKVCRGCNETKPLEDFSLHKGFKDGRNSKCKSCKTALQLEGIRSGRYKKRSQAYRRKDQIKSRYGMTTDQYDEMLKSQNSCCAICLKQMDKPNIDHCHSTGKVRGILCWLCNTALGKFEDDTERLQRAIKYLDGEPTGS